MISQVVASERETAQTGDVTASSGLKDGKKFKRQNENVLGKTIVEGDNPVSVKEFKCFVS